MSQFVVMTKGKKSARKPEKGPVPEVTLEAMLCAGDVSRLPLLYGLSVELLGCVVAAPA